MATKGTVSGVIANMVTLVVDGPVAQNEICYISTGGDKLMAEVIKVVGTQVYVQVFESTRGLKVGAEAEFTGHMLEVTLGPGMLSKNYDGLQNDLDKMDGVFLKRGQYTYPLDKGSKWHFVPLAKVGDQVEAAAWLGQVDENFQPLKIMVPFEQKGDYYRLASFAENGRYDSYMVVSKDKSQAVLIYVQVVTDSNVLTKKLKLYGLEPGKKYIIDGVEYLGSTLMNVGYIMKPLRGDFQSAVVEINPA